MWVGTALAGFPGGTGASAQDVVDLPAEDLPLPADFELVYRIGSTEARAEWEQHPEVPVVAAVRVTWEGTLWIE